MQTYQFSSIIDIDSHQNHYLNKLVLEPDSNTPILYFYGPYLTYHYNDKIVQLLSNHKNNIKGWNPVFRLFCEVSSLIRNMEKAQEISSCKKFILETIKRCQDYPFDYTSLVVEIANDYMTKIRENQFENKILESAILDFSPIVQYCGTLTRPDMKKEMDVSLDNIINKCILDKDILSKVIKESNMVFNIPYVLDMILESYRKMEVASLYYVTVYIHYYVPKDKQNEIISKIKEVSNMYDEISSGRIIDVSKAMESIIEIESYIRETYEEG